VNADDYALAVDILAADGLDRYSAEVIISNQRQRGEALSLVAYAQRLVAARQTRDGVAARREEAS